jgi:hypothetical protein
MVYIYKKPAAMKIIAEVNQVEPRVPVLDHGHVSTAIVATGTPGPIRLGPKTLYKKTVQHNVDDDILTKQCFPRAHR